MDEQCRDVIKQLNRNSLVKLVERLEEMNDEEYRDLIIFLKSVV